MERETKKLKTSQGNEIELKTYVSGGEYQEIQDIFLDGVKLKINDEALGEDPLKDVTVSASLAGKATKKALELLIVSFNGEKEDVLEKVLALPNEEYNEVIEMVDSVRYGMDNKKKQK